MKLEVEFSEQSSSFDVEFGEVINVSSGGFDEGYEAGYARGYTEGHDAGTAEGYTKGHEDGVKQGYADGLAARTYETWTITLTDGTVVEKEVALL